MMRRKNIQNHVMKTELTPLGLSAVEPWSEPVDGGALLDGMAGMVKRFVVLPKWGPEALALWTLHTFAFYLRDVTTYVGIESPEKRCGKTTLLTVLSEMVNRPVVASNISPPAFFRVIEESQPTLLIDEADTFLRGNEELRGILNAGYTRKTAYVVRVTQAGGRADGAGTRLARFSCWCPKLMAAIGRLPETLADRCIVIRMQRKRADEPCERSKAVEGGELKRRCARFVLDHETEIAGARPAIPPGLNDRAGDVWEPLLGLADVAGGRWPGLAREAAVGLTGAAEEGSAIGALLLDILVVLRVLGAGRVPSRELVAQLNARSGRPWGELNRGRPVDELWLARQLRPYGVRPRNMRWEGQVAKGYLGEDFEEVFRRYIPRTEFEALREECREVEQMEGGGSSGID
jgi:putative DNA primase/helicase